MKVPIAEYISQVCLYVSISTVCVVDIQTYCVFDLDLLLDGLEVVIIELVLLLDSLQMFIGGLVVYLGVDG